MAHQNSEQQTPSQPLPGDVRATKSEYPCPDCGEQVREGLVRCWNCGSFLRPEIEESYRKMQENPAPVIFSPVPEAEQASLDDFLASPQARSSDVDFELAGAATAQPAAAPSEAAPAAEEEPATDQPQPPGDDGPQVPHSVATGGDALLQVALQEEAEALRKKLERGAGLEGVMKIRDGFLIDAPKGCRIQVRDERTGELRRLTFAGISKVRISLLDKLEALQKARDSREKEKEQAGPAHLSAGKFKRWMPDVHVHEIDPQKLKLKADSMTKDYAEMEFGFADDGLLTASLAPAKKGGLFGGGSKDGGKEETREKLLEHCRTEKSVDDGPASEKHWFPADNLVEMRVVQPGEALLAGVPVFGSGRIAVQLPTLEAGAKPRVASFLLTEFREFVEIVGALYSLTDFGRNLGIPLADAFSEHKCHYSGAPVRALEHVEFYETDPKIELVIAGWKCEACGLAVSEVAREKEKLGGAGGKGMAKQKCPKCQQKMGSHPLYTLASTTAEPAPSGSEPAAEAAAPAETPQGDDSSPSASEAANPQTEKTGN